MEGFTDLGLGYLGAGIAAGLATIGAGLGIGRIAESACQGTARQPEAADQIFRTMIIPAAMIEAIALFAVVAGFLMVTRV